VRKKQLTKAAKMAKVSVRGGFNLLWGLVASTVISSLGTIFTANLLGDSNFGLYTIALAAPNLISNFRDWGVTGAMIKYTAQYNAEGKAANIRSIFSGGIFFETVLGLVLAAVAFLLSGYLASLYSLPNITPLIQIASFTILTSALLGTAQAAFNGMEKMELNSIALIVQAIIKTAAIPALVIFGLGPLGAVIGFAIASLVAGLIALLLMWSLYKNLPKPTNNTPEIKATVKTMFDYGFPLSIATIIGTVQTQFYGFILPIFVAPDLMGNYGIANTFVVLIAFFATPVSTMLFPAFSKLDPQKDRETLRNVFQYSIKYASLLVVPAATVVMALAKPGVSILFPKYPTAPLLLALLAINYLYVAFGSLSIGNLINGQGQTRFNLKLSLITFGIGFPLSIVLISRFGILGLIVTTLTTGIPSLVVALRWLKKQYGVTVDWASSAKILLSGGTASAITYTVITQLAFSNLVALVAGALVFLFTFLTAIILTGAITRSDIDTLRDATTVLGPLGHLANSVLNMIEKLMTTLRS
jgi:O-antigen/teichoic acid export membrane protein